MVALRFTKDYKLELLSSTQDDSNVNLETEAYVDLTMNSHVKQVLKQPEEQNSIRIITKKFAYTSVPDETLIDLHSIAFTLVYIVQREEEGTATDADKQFFPICEEAKSLHTWPHARKCPIAFAAEFVESLTQCIQEETAFLSIQRAWLLPIMHLITIGRPSHLAHGQYLFPFYRALKSEIPFFTVAAYTEFYGRQALCMKRRGKPDNVLGSDQRIVSLLKTAASKFPWLCTDAADLADQMSSMLYYLKEYQTLVDTPTDTDPTSRSQSKCQRHFHKHQLTEKGRRSENMEVLKELKDPRASSVAQALKKDKTLKIRLELMPSGSRKRGCPDNYDPCARITPESVNWIQLVEAMEMSDLMITDEAIQEAFEKAKEVNLWSKEATMTKEERKKIYSNMGLTPPIDLLQRIILFGNVTTDPQAQSLSSDNKENALTYTTNKALALENTGSKILDFFVAGADTPLSPLIEEAWEADPLSTLKILFYHRSITEGKGNATSFIKGARYVFNSHYRTFLWNLPYLAFALDCSDDVKMSHPFGCWKDLLEMLRQWTEIEEPVVSPAEPSSQVRPAKRARHGEGPTWREPHMTKRDPDSWKEVLTDLYSKQSKLHQFQEVVAFLFAIQLRRDLTILKKYTSEEDPDSKKTLRLLLSLAGKWAPSPNRSHDRWTYVATNIARLLYPEMPTTSKEDIERLRWRYRTECLRPLRTALDIPERLITLQQYHDIRLKSMPSRALQLYTNCLTCFAPQVVERTLARKLGLNAAHIEPQKIVEKASMVANINEPPRTLVFQADRPKYKYRSGSEAERKLIEAQWKEFVKSLADVPGMNNCVALCDVSGSMQNAWNAMDWAIAFSLVISELCTGPFRGKIITFQSQPQFVDDDVNASIFERVAQIKMAPWGGSTNLEAAMNLILELAIISKYPPEEMKALTLFIFSDMQFNEAIINSGDAPKLFHEVIQSQYAAEGYTLPRIIYWNMTGSPNQPVSGSTPNTVLLSGTGMGILRSLMCGEELALQVPDGEEELALQVSDGEKNDKHKKTKEERTPYDAMVDVLALACYQKLAILD